jgi:hypothetical protein
MKGAELRLLAIIFFRPAICEYSEVADHSQFV